MLTNLLVRGEPLPEWTDRYRSDCRTPGRVVSPNQPGPRDHMPSWVSDPIPIELKRPEHTVWLWGELWAGLLIAARELGPVGVAGPTFQALSQRNPRVPDIAQIYRWAKRRDTTAHVLYAQACEDVAGEGA